MAADNLIGQYISSTFRKLLQLSDSGSYITDGTGSVVNVLPTTASWAQTASYALNAVGTITNAIYAETASYSTTLGASLDNTINSPDQVFLVSSDGSILSGVVITDVQTAYNAGNAGTVSVAAPTGTTQLWLPLLESDTATSAIKVDSEITYDSSSKTLNVTSSYAISSSYVLSSSYAQTASYFVESDPIFTAKSASLATTGSNIFKGNQTVSGSVIFEAFGSPPTPAPGALYFDGTNLYLGV